MIMYQSTKHAVLLTSSDSRSETSSLDSTPLKLVISESATESPWAPKEVLLSWYSSALGSEQPRSSDSDPQEPVSLPLLDSSNELTSISSNPGPASSKLVLIPPVINYFSIFTVTWQGLTIEYYRLRGQNYSYLFHESGKDSCGGNK